MAVSVQEVVLVPSGDSRLAANQQCWPAQEALETAAQRHCQTVS
jgi:hypothetical protein